jgi:hypothetical protein
MYNLVWTPVARQMWADGQMQERSTCPASVCGVAVAQVGQVQGHAPKGAEFYDDDFFPIIASM